MKGQGCPVHRDGFHRFRWTKFMDDYRYHVNGAGYVFRIKFCRCLAQTTEGKYIGKIKSDLRMGTIREAVESVLEKVNDPANQESYKKGKK